MVGWHNPLPIRQKLMGASSKERGSVSEVGGKMFGRLPGQRGVIAQGYWILEPP